MSEIVPFEFQVTQPVKKIKGYAYFGEVVAAFHTRKGENRYVVESTSHGSLGMLFIFNAGQLASDDDDRTTPHAA